MELLVYVTERLGYGSLQSPKLKRVAMHLSLKIFGISKVARGIIFYIL
jgi:hypothetical protein